jgi:hypothetical protein
MCMWYLTCEFFTLYKGIIDRTNLSMWFLIVLKRLLMENNRHLKENRSMLGQTHDLHGMYDTSP